MPIQRSTLVEPVLTRAEMNVVREIDHASQIAAAIEALNKTESTIQSLTSIQVNPAKRKTTDKQISSLRDFLTLATMRVLNNIKTPNISFPDEETNVPSVKKVEGPKPLPPKPSSGS